MRLHWKFILIINGFTLLALGFFFAYDYYYARGNLNAAYLENFRVGGNLSKIALLIADELREQPFGKSIQATLKEIQAQHPVEMADVIDIHVTDFDLQIIGSLRGEADGDLVLINDQVYDTLRAGGMYIGDIAGRADGQRASVVITPYLEDERWVQQGETWTQEVRFAVIQIVFSTEKVWSLLNGWRMRHLLYVFLTSLVLQVVVINLAMARMISRPLQQIIEAIERAEEGDLEMRDVVTYSKSGIGRLPLSLYRMLGQMRAAQRERIAALGTLAAGVAHEIRNPLNYIAMTAQYLKRLLSAPKVTSETLTEARESLDTVLEEVESLNEITRRFLELTRPVVLEREPTDVNDLLDSVVASMAVALKEGSVDVVRRYAPSRKLLLDPNKLRQALVNLIQNAIQAMAPRGGRIYLSTSYRQGIAGERLLIEVRDTGPGMPAHVLEHIFEAYFTTREEEGGIGLGLPITRQIIQAHDGQIEVRSQEGMGTAFLINLPVIEQGDAATAQTA